MYPTGHINDAPAVVARRPKFHLHPRYATIKATPLPLSTNNRQFMPTSKGGPGIQNQNDLSACEGFAHSSGATLRMAIAGTPIALLSALGLYYGALLVDCEPNADGSLPPLLDSGTMPSSIVTAWNQWGATSATTWGQLPPSSSTVYKTPSDPNSPLILPKPEQLFAEQACKFGGAYFPSSVGDQRLFDIMACLAAGYPVSVAIAASGSVFQQYHGGVLGQLSGPIDHASLWVDYAWDGSNIQTITLIGANSWGEAWGESDIGGISAGLYRGNYQFASQATDACVLEIAEAA